jgi:hypothetical protein
VPELVLANLGVAVRAAVQPGVDAAVVVATHDDGRVGHLRRLEVARVRNLDVEPDVIPYRAAEDAFLFERIDVLIHEHPTGHAGNAVLLAGPVEGGDRWALDGVHRFLLR